MRFLASKSRSRSYSEHQQSKLLLKVGLFLLILSILSSFILPILEIQNLDEEFITAILFTCTFISFILSAMLYLINEVELQFTKIMIVATSLMIVTFVVSNFTLYGYVAEYAEILDLIIKGCIGVITAWIIYKVYMMLFRR